MQQQYDKNTYLVDDEEVKGSVGQGEQELRVYACAVDGERVIYTI
jgi:hypothetical protein